MSIESSKGVWKSGPGRGRVRPKGRQLDDLAWSQVQDLLGQRPRRRDLLIEFLHLIQDAYGHLSAAHLRALAEEMRLSQAEVYEVATFYAHFDVVKEGETTAGLDRAGLRQLVVRIGRGGSIARGFAAGVRSQICAGCSRALHGAL